MSVSEDGEQRAMSDGLGYLEDGLPGLLDLLRGSDVRELEVCDGSLQLRLHRAGVVEDGTLDVVETLEILDSEEAEPIVTSVAASLVGTFYRAEQPGSAPFVSEGSHVQTDTVVGIIEALSVLTEIEAGCDGVVTRVLATDGQPVEYGQPLFEVSPHG